MTESTPGLSDHVVAPTDASVFDTWDPANISPLVATLAMEDCDITGQVFFVQGGTVRKFQNWTMTSTLEKTRSLVGRRTGRATAHAVAVSEERRGAHVDREDADGLLNARTDPAAEAFARSAPSRAAATSTGSPSCATAPRRAPRDPRATSGGCCGRCWLGSSR